MDRPVGEDTAKIDDDDSLPWWPSGDRRRAASRSGLTRDRIITAGVELIQKEGFEALTMRRVAECLNSGVMSLYWYVANRDELVAVVVDELLRGVPTPSPDAPWREQLVEVCRAFGLDPSAPPARPSGPPLGIAPGPHLLRMTNDIYGALTHAGFTGDDVVQGVEAIGSLTIGLLFSGITEDESSQDSEHPTTASAVPNGLRDVDFAVLKASRYPNLVAAGAARRDGDGLMYALGTLLDGLEVRLRLP